MRTRTTTTATRPTWVDRAGALSGAAYVVLILVGNQLASGSSQDSHPSGAKDLADFSGSPTLAQASGFRMEVVGLLAFMFFLGWLVHRLREHGGAAAWLAGVAGVAGTVTSAMKIGSAAPIMAGEIDHRQLSPALARVLADMNGATFVITFLTTGVFLLATGLAVLASGYLGRVAGWTAVVIGALGVGLTLATGIDPVNTNPMPFLAGLLWILVVSIRLGWRGPRVVHQSIEPTPVPAMT
jgi:hypothetical protein